MPDTRDKLSYPLPERPADGDTLQLAPGIRWLRMPLPFVLNHINLWLLDDDDGLTVVDTGIDSRKSRAIWEQALSGQSVRRVIATHLHPDHAGLAGWLCREHAAELWMSREEYLLARVLSADQPPPPPEAIAFYRRAGFSEQQLATYAERFGQFGAVVSAAPQSYRRLQAGDELSLGAHRWRVVIGRGHSPEHVCLLCEELGLLIAGDQVLPTISPNIGVWPTEPEANPLADWLESCRRLRATLSDELLVLPAHGRPFRGLHARLTALIDEHERGLEQLRALCREPQRVIDVFPALFRGRIDSGNLVMAVGESVAHLRYLQAEGEIQLETDAHGVDWYRVR